MDFQTTKKQTAYPAGYTLVELVSTIAISSILLAIAVPSFQWLNARTRISTSINLFLSHIYQARSEAVKREQLVVLCPSSDGQSCNAGYMQWANGYMVFVDNDRNRVRNEKEQLLAYFQGTAGQIKIHSSSSSRSTLAYSPTGRALNSNTTLRFCIEDHDRTNRALIIASTGRPRLSKTMPDGSRILCN